MIKHYFIYSLCKVGKLNQTEANATHTNVHTEKKLMDIEKSLK